jgi:hypothetical protein
LVSDDVYKDFIVAEIGAGFYPENFTYDEFEYFSTKPCNEVINYKGAFSYFYSVNFPRKELFLKKIMDVEAIAKEYICERKKGEIKPKILSKQIKYDEEIMQYLKEIGQKHGINQEKIEFSDFCNNYQQLTLFETKTTNEPNCQPQMLSSRLMYCDTNSKVPNAYEIAKILLATVVDLGNLHVKSKLKHFN